MQEDHFFIEKKKNETRRSDRGGDTTRDAVEAAPLETIDRRIESIGRRRRRRRRRPRITFGDFVDARRESLLQAADDRETETPVVGAQRHVHQIAVRIRIS